MLIQKQDLCTGSGIGKVLPGGMLGGMKLSTDMMAVGRSEDTLLSYPIVRGILKLISEPLDDVTLLSSNAISFTALKAKSWVYTEEINGVKVLKLAGFPFSTQVLNFNFAIALGLFLLMNQYPNFVNALKGLLSTSTGSAEYPGLLAKLSDEMLLAVENMLIGKDPSDIAGIITQRDEPSFNGVIPGGDKLGLAFKSIDNLNDFLNQPSPTKYSCNNGDFSGDLIDKLTDCIVRGKHVLLTGPTATGKTLAVEQACQEIGAPLVLIRGCDGLEDRDLLGSTILTSERTGNGGIATKSQFIYGPVSRVILTAAKNPTVPVVLFVDEINRMQTRHQNLILSLLNLKKSTNEYSLYIPDIGIELTCPNGSLVVIAARNIGASFAGINQMDLALERRFFKKLSVDYLPQEAELNLVVSRTGLSEKAARVLAKVASDTRYQLSQLKAPLDTDSLLKWSEELTCMETKGYLINANDVLNAAKDIIFDICLDRDERGIWEQASEAILSDNISENWKDEFKEAVL